jgi:hypothetical protein
MGQVTRIPSDDIIRRFAKETSDPAARQIALVLIEERVRHRDTREKLFKAFDQISWHRERQIPLLGEIARLIRRAWGNRVRIDGVGGEAASGEAGA